MDGEKREALLTLLLESLRWASFCAGEGMCREEGDGYHGPEDFLMAYSLTLSDDVDWPDLPDMIVSELRGALMTPPRPL